MSKTILITGATSGIGLEMSRRFHALGNHIIAVGRNRDILGALEGEMEELYDLEADPDELTNLSEMPDMKQQLVSLRTATVAELKRTGAGIADNLPAVANP